MNTLPLYDEAAVQTTYHVTGMTCEHCRRAVTEELLEVPGVRTVDVDLERGRVVVGGHRVSIDAVRVAVETAGYEVAP